MFILDGGAIQGALNAGQAGIVGENPDMIRAASKELVKQEQLAKLDQAGIKVAKNISDGYLGLV